MANVFGTESSETINGFDGVTNAADTIFGFGGDDTIFGLGGNDLILGGGGADSINGGSGTDTASYTDSTEAVFVSLISNLGSGGTAQGDTFTSIENVTGSSHADTLVGDDGNNVLTGLESNDSLKGGGGADTLYGDSGNDILKGGGGADTLNGGSGIDTVNYAGSTAAVIVSLSADTANGGDATGDELNSIENLTGSGHNDALTGNDGVNVLNGGEGADTINGLGANDTINGGEGGDILNGGTGTDTLSYAGSEFGVVVNLGNGMVAGGDAAGDTILLFENVIGSSQADSLFGDGLINVLIGAAGNDFLFGGANNDVFAFSAGFGHDTILDFAPGGDDIQFRTEVFANFAQVMANATQVGTDVVITKDAGNTITLDNVLLGSLAASDFLFV
jgi:Ca2+-binding RTX toxin-like protein